MKLIYTLSIFLRDAGAYDLSNEMLEIKKEVEEYTLGKNHLKLSDTYKSIGRNHMNMNAYDKAVDSFLNLLILVQ